MVDTHSYKLSPFGPALQFVGGSNEISANSFWMRLALLDSELFFSLMMCLGPSSRARWRSSVLRFARASARRSIDLSSIFRSFDRRVASRRVAHSRPTEDATRRDARRQFKVTSVVVAFKRPTDRDAIDDAKTKPARRRDARGLGRPGV